MSEETIFEDTSGWPIVVSRIYGDAHSDAMLDRAYAAWSGYMRRGKHVLIVDMREGSAGATARQRSRMAAWVTENEASLKAGRQLAHILVTESALVRGFITAVAWLKPPANPQYVEASMEAAAERARNILQKAGVAFEERAVEAVRDAAAPRPRASGG